MLVWGESGERHLLGMGLGARRGWEQQQGQGKDQHWDQQQDGDQGYDWDWRWHQGHNQDQH